MKTNRRKNSSRSTLQKQKNQLKSKLKKNMKKLRKKNNELDKLSISTRDSMSNSQKTVKKKSSKSIENKNNKILNEVYCVKKVLGKGANNKVYLVEHIQNNKLYAMKVFKIKDLQDSKKLFYLKVTFNFILILFKTN
jgi:protein-serine/threonine kinase